MNKENKFHGILAGSLNVGNIGDHALVKSFIHQHSLDYNMLTILGIQHPELVDTGVNILAPPPLAIGRRFWNGYFERKSTKNLIFNLLPDAERHYIWHGGLLGSYTFHLKSRLQELKWSLKFCDKFIYYFGDVHQGFNDQSITKPLVNKLNQSNTWIAVRSLEAAELLSSARYKYPIHIGIDPALYERCKNINFPIVRQHQNAGIMTIIVCKYNQKDFSEIWRIAALIAIIKNLKIAWTSHVDSEDLELCEELFSEFHKEHPNHPMEIVPAIHAERIIKQSSVCISARLHGCIFGVAAGIPTIGLTYGDKIARLFKLLEIQDWLIYAKNKNDNKDNNNYLHEIILDRVNLAIDHKFNINHVNLSTGVEMHKEAIRDFKIFIKK